MSKKRSGSGLISSKAIRSLRARIQSTFGDGDESDLIANPLFLEKLTSYARIVTKKPVTCQWGNENKTDLNNLIILNPYDPDRNTPAADRKIVIDAVLEHEIRGHWQHTPRQVFETVINISEGHSEVSNQEYWKVPKHASRLHAIRHLFNILEDGRIETRIRWEQPAVYEIIAAGDLIRPRWKREPVYRAAKKVFSAKLNKYKNRKTVKCNQCGQNESVEGEICETCFVEQYRWEQISGALLMSVLPPHTPPLEIIEPEVRTVIQECFPLLVEILRGTAKDCMNISLEILKKLINHGMVPPRPSNNHLSTNDAAGHPDAKDTKISQKNAVQAGLSGLNISDTKVNSSQNKDSNKNKKQSQNTADHNNNKSSTGEQSSSDNQSNKDSKENNRIPELDELANHDLQDFDVDVHLDILTLRRKAQVLLDSLQYTQDAQRTYDLIMGVSGIGAGPGVDRGIRRVQGNQRLYEVVRNRNLEAGRRFAREIDDLVHSLSQPQRFQRTGRLDRKQLVNAVARGKNTVFIRPKIHYQLDLAVIISVDLSGSMSAYNKLIGLHENYRPSPVQLVDAVATCAIGFERLKVPYEIRAFGSYQWLVKGFYDRDPYGVGGMAGKDDGGTDMLPAVEYAAIAMLGRQEKDRLIIIMTDGWPTNIDTTSEKIRTARMQGNQVMGILFDYPQNTKKRDQSDPAMSKLFGPNGFTVIHSLYEFPTIVGSAIKEIVRLGFISAKE